MKPSLVILILLALGLGAFLLMRQEPKATPPPITSTVDKTPYWEQELPPDLKLLDEGKTPKINVVCERQNAHGQTILNFLINEEHGYMVDGIDLAFWYRFYDDDTDTWVNDQNKVHYFVKKRLGFNETLVDNTVLLPVEYQHLDIDLSATTSENWQAEVVKYVRAMEPKVD